MSDFSTIPEVINDIKQGQMVVVVDKADRENQGDLIFSAHAVTDEKINFMLKYGRGMICCPVTKTQIIQFDLPLMVQPSENTEITGVNFTVSVDAKNVSSFGISAKDKSLTIATLANPNAKSTDLVRPGHVFPLLSADGGILEREGHTEATIELLHHAQLPAVGVLCEILQDNGEVAKYADLVKFSKRFNLKMISVADLIDYVLKHPRQKFSSSLVIKKATSLLPTKYGDFQIIIYKSIYDNFEHVVLKKETKGGGSSLPLVRLHSKCLTGDTLSSLRCDCGGQLQQSMKQIGKTGGVIVYLNQEGRGIGLVNKINAYYLQDQGVDTVDANVHLGFPIDARDYQVAADILKDLGISRIRLLTNNPEKEKSLEKFGIVVKVVTPLEVSPNKINRSYLLVKKQKLGHKLTRV